MKPFRWIKLPAAILTFILLCAPIPSAAEASSALPLSDAVRTEMTEPKTDETALRKPAAQKDTKVRGLKTSIVRKASRTLRDAVTISPAYGRKVYLQLYDETSGTWKTKKKFVTENQASSSITLTYPSAWKKTTHTRWRVYLPAAREAKKYVSPDICVTAQNIVPIEMSARSFVLMEADTGTVLYGKKENKSYANASTTKMMTALLCLEKNRMSGKVRISKNAANTPYACLYMKPGDSFYVKNLMTAMLVRSSNDAAAALAEDTAGSVKKFAKLMNARAKKLGCRNTHFVNPHGLDAPGHYSSAYDLCLIQRAALKYKTYRNALLRKSYTFYNTRRTRKYTVTATDKLLGQYDGFLGGKTGFTDDAGQCFCGAYEKDGRTYLFAVLGCSTSDGRWRDCQTLIEYIRKYV